MSGLLGKRPFVPDDRDLRFSSYATLELPTAPKRFGFGRLYADWGTLGNDVAGDCTVAGAAHETMIWNKVRHGRDVAFDDEAVLSDYSAITGYDPADPDTDQGAYVRDVMNYRRRTGLVDAGGHRHKIVGYVSFDAKDWDHLVRGSYVFAAVGIGFEFPASAFDQFDAGERWDYVDGSEILGGHYVPVVGSVDSQREATCVTWGRRQTFSREFYERLGDEAWGMVTEELIRPDGVGLHGFDLDRFKADLKLL